MDLSFKVVVLFGGFQAVLDDRFFRERIETVEERVRVWIEFDGVGDYVQIFRYQIAGGERIQRIDSSDWRRIEVQHVLHAGDQMKIGGLQFVVELLNALND